SDVAGDRCICRTSLLAGGQDRAVLNAVFRATPSFFTIDTRGINALHAIGVFLHHATAAHRDVRVAHHFEAGRVIVGEKQKIKAPDFIGTVVGAIPGANAAVVHHVIQAFSAVDGSAYRANRLTRRILALHARDRLEIGLWIG